MAPRGEARPGVRRQRLVVDDPARIVVHGCGSVLWRSDAASGSRATALAKGKEQLGQHATAALKGRRLIAGASDVRVSTGCVTRGSSVALRFRPSLLLHRRGVQQFFDAAPDAEETKAPSRSRRRKRRRKRRRSGGGGRGASVPRRPGAAPGPRARAPAARHAPARRQPHARRPADHVRTEIT